MHSSKLRGSDFQITTSDQPVAHADFFADTLKIDRLGVVAPKRYEAIGAVTLIMAYVTAFYDHYRSEGSNFFAYPDYFTFQKENPVADYAMLDIWPAHKNIHIPDNANESAAAITDRGVNILLVPDHPPLENTYKPVQTESLCRNIQRSFLYSETGNLENPTLEITTKAEPFKEWIIKPFDSVPEDPTLQSQKQHWLQTDSTTLTQTFREISLDKAIKHL